MGRYARWVSRWAGWITLGCAVLTGAAGVYSVRIFRELRTEISELLPQEARSVRDLDRVAQTLESTDALALLVFSRHSEASRRFVDDLARRARRELRGQVTWVDHRIDRELAFFRKRAALFLEPRQLEQLRDRIQARIDYEREIRNPLNIVSGKEIPLPAPIAPDQKAWESGPLEIYRRFPDGYYATPDGQIRVVLFHLQGRSYGADRAQALRDAVDRLVAELGPLSYSDDLTLHFTGDVQNLIEERASLISDLELSTAVVVVLVMLAMLVFYRDVRATAALVLSCLAGTFWTFGISWFAVGYLNANSAFLGSIVLGNGINYGIVLLARYFEELRGAGSALPADAKGRGEVLDRALRGTWKGTLAAAGAAGLSYGSLTLTRFRGYHQFGIIGLIGMAACWISAYLLLPALLELLARHRPPDQGALGRSRHRFAEWVSTLVDRHAGLLTGLSVVLSLAASASVVVHRKEVLEMDTSKLRDRRSLQSGSGFYSRYLDQIFGRSLSPVAILTDTPAQAWQVQRLVEEARRRDGAGSLVQSVLSIRSFVPPLQARKIQTLQEIRQLLRPGILARLGPRERKQAKDFLTPEAFRPFGVADLPGAVKSHFRTRDGTVDRLVLVEPINRPGAMDQAQNQIGFIELLRGIADAVHPGLPVVGQLPLSVDVIESMERDGPKVTLAALVLVMLLVLALLRDIRAIVLTLASLWIGVLWFAGAALALGLRIVFLNFIVLPITFGIGVDYAVNIFQRYHEEGRVSIARVVRGAGAGVALASLTTIIGYSSLLIAGNQGFVSFGRLAVLGEVACLTAALLGVPAWARLRERARPVPQVTSAEVPRDRRAA